MKPVFRRLARDRAFTAVAVLTLALGIGASTAIFSLADAVLLKPLAYREPGRLYAAHTVLVPLMHLYPTLPANARHFREWEKRVPSVESMALLAGGAVHLTGAGEPERIETLRATSEFFRVLGVGPRLGRGFAAGEDQRGRDKVAVISDSLWRRRFGADPRAVGSTVRLNDEPHEIIGVLGPEFRFPRGIEGFIPVGDRNEIVLPLVLRLERTSAAGEFNFTPILRLRPGVAPERVIAEMNAVLADFSREAKAEMRSLLSPLQDAMTSRVRASLWLLLGGVAAVLAIVCLNLGNLVLVRAAGRMRDAAIRAALGANRAQLARAAAAEVVVLALAGGVLGTMLAAAGVRALVARAPVNIPRLDEVAVDLRVLLFALAASLAAALVCGLGPVLRLARSSPQDVLRPSSHTLTESRADRRARSVLVGCEVALSMTLLAVSALLMVSFIRVLGVEKGFETSRILTFDVNLPGKRYAQPSDRNRFHDRMLAALRALPGVRSAGLSTSLPLGGETWVDTLTREGDTNDLKKPIVNYRFVSPDYWQSVGIPLLQGRFIEERDRGRPVAVVAEAAAKAAWPGETPLGKKMARSGNPGVWLEVVGVVKDVRTGGLEKAPALMAYEPYWGMSPNRVSYAVRTSGDPAPLATHVRTALHGIDPELPVERMRSMEQVLDDSVAPRRFQTMLVTAFGASSLLLACLGIYGVVSYGVTRRTAEMGVRMAVGAGSRELVAMLLRQGMTPVALGLLAGTAGAFAASRLIAGMVYGVGARDPATLAAVAALLALSALIACYVPARRASRVDPLRALRWE
jgi:predicted permease